MFLDELLGDFQRDPRLGGGDSFCDALNSYWTVLLLSGFASIVTTSQYFMDHVICYCPAHFTHSQVHFTNNVS